MNGTSPSWPLVPLGELTDNYDSVRVPVKEADRKPGPYPYYGASGVVDRVDGYLFDGEYLLVAEDGENLRTRQTPVAFLAAGKFWVNNHAHIVRANHKSNTRYLMYALWQADIGAYLTGSTMPKLTQGNMNRIPIPAPPLPVQHRIAHVLGTLDDKIESNRRMNETLEAMARSLFKSWFVDYDPVRAKADGRQPSGLDAATASLFPDSFEDSLLGPIPKGWRACTLGDCVELKRGYDLPAQEREPGNVPIISSSGPTGFHGKSMARGPGVVTGRYGTIGQVFYVEEDFWPLNTTLYAKDFKGHSPRFVFHLLGTVQFHDYSDKAAVPGINRNHLHQAKIVLPASEIEKRFAQLVEPYWMRHSANDREAATLAALRDALLPKLLSGEVKVPDHEPVE